MAEDKKPPVDWESVEREYRVGIKTLRQIADDHGITHGAINKRSKRDGWTRDLTAKIQAKADALVSKAEVSSEVSKADLVTERLIVDANAEMMANVIRGHRRDVGRLRGVVSMLLEKVEAILKESDLFEKIGEMCANPDENGYDKINELYNKVISLPSQTDSTKKLAETMKILIEIERKIFKIDGQDEEGPVEAAARGAAQGAAAGMGESSKSILAGLIAELTDEKAPA